MNESLTDLGNAISAAHKAVTDLVEFVEEHDAPRHQWHIGLADAPPQLIYDVENPDSETFARELPDQKTARYALREAADRGFTAEEPDDDEGDEGSEQQGRWLFAYSVA